MASGGADGATSKAVVRGGDSGDCMEVREGVGDMEGVGGCEGPLEVDVLFDGDGEAEVAEQVVGDGCNGDGVEGSGLAG